MLGKIVKGIGGFYYVNTVEGIYECKAKGIFRRAKIRPLVGDNVEIEVLDEEKKLGNLEKVFPRKNLLIRPAVTNVDQALVIFAGADPAPNLNLLDRFLLMMEVQQVKTVICFNKSDIVDTVEMNRLLSIYEKSGNGAFAVSARQEQGIQKIRDVLKGKTTVLAGPSGVGKSTVVNMIAPLASMETGEVSEKIRRGRHTTRHSELFSLDTDTYVMDTPGFSSLGLPKMEKEDLKDYFPEFSAIEGRCKYQGCTHVHEPFCVVKEAREKGQLCESRYKNYIQIYEELSEQKKY